jgi:ribosomal protein L17
LPAGQRRWHFVHERTSRRRQIVDALTASDQVTALIFHAKGHETAIRAESFRRMVQPLLKRNVTRLVIESREGRDHLDRQVLLGELRGRPTTFGYDHMPPHGDPLLWVADAVAWCSSAGGVWRERIEPLVVWTQDISQP